MVRFKAQARPFNEFSPEPAPDPEAPSWSDMFSAAIQMDNDVVNFIDAISSEPEEPEPGFKLGTSLKDYDTENGTSFLENYGDAFIGTSSTKQMLSVIQQIREEQENRDTLARSGWAGYAASIASGLASPLTFVPLVGAGTRAAQVGKMAAIGFTTSAVAESALQAGQVTRTWQESAIGIAAGTALAGILGGVLRTMTPEARLAAERTLERAAEEIRYSGKPQPGGAAIAELPDAGNIADGALTVSRAVNKTGVLTNPITENIDQTDFPTWRSLTQSLGDAGLAMERNAEGVATAVGGTLENRVATYAGILNNAVENFNSIYAKYFYEGAPPRFAQNLRSEVGGFLSSSKLSKRQFSDEVTKAIWSGYQHQIPEVVEAAKVIAKEVFEPILERAQKVGLLGEDVKVVGDEAYVHRMYNVTAIQSKTAKFVNTLARNYEAKLNKDFAADLEKLYAKQTKLGEALEDIQRPGDEAERLIEKYRRALDDLNENVPDDIAITEETARDMRALARELKGKPGLENEAKRKQLLADARDMERSLGGKDLQDVKIARAEIRRRLRNLTQTRALVDAKRAKKLELIERIDEQNIAALNRVAKKAQAVLGKLGKISDEKLDAEISKLKTEFERVGRLYDKGEEKLVELGETPSAERTMQLQEQRADRLSTISDKLEQAEGFDRVAARDAIQEGLDALIEKVNQVNNRRAVRQARLVQEQKALTPEAYHAKLQEMQATLPRLEAEFNERWSQAGAESVDAKTGRAAFKDLARQRAEAVKDKIVGTYLRLPAMEMLGTERGAELARVLDIPSKEIEEFLETDINAIIRAYTRTMAPDIELYRKFGSMDWREIIQPAVEELNQKIQKIEGDETLSEAQKVSQTKKLNDDFSKYKRNFEALIERLRGVRGMPSDPEAISYRAARTVMNLNVLRLMGGVTISSFPDLAQPVLKYGLTRTFRDGFLPLINNLKTFKLNAREAKIAGAAIDITSHSRAMAIRDIVDDMQRGSKFEKGIEWATNRMGLVALFDYWTQGMKTFTGSVANAKIMDALAAVNDAGSNMTLKESTKYLAELGIDGNLAERMWKEVRDNAGGGKIDGVWWPNTESWQDPDTVMAYRQALYREISRTIIQPGMERPLLSDVNTLWRMLYQFKSFGLASTPKVMLAGLQQKDAAILSGSLASLGLGALGYYFWALASGGRAYEEMQNAGIDKWADEAINRSGLIGGMTEVQRIGQNIPLISDYVSFSGRPSTRRPGDNILEAILGPSFDFGQGTTALIGGMAEPTQSTLHEFRKLLPFQNVFFLRQALDAVESSIGSNLPERRGQ